MRLDAPRESSSTSTTTNSAEGSSTQILLPHSSSSSAKMMSVSSQMHGGGGDDILEYPTQHSSADNNGQIDEETGGHHEVAEIRDDDPTIPSYRKNLYLYSEQSGSVLLPNVIHSLVTRSIGRRVSRRRHRAKSGGGSGGQANNNGPADGNEDVASNANSTESSTCRDMGTLAGVYFPCLQNILGVMFFIRLSWIVGIAGCLYGFLVVFICCSVTMLTAISMSAIATNGIVPSGGAYVMISRSLGPELGGAVGILFYIGNTLVACICIVGAIEILITYIAPGITLFGDTKILSNMHNNYRVYGSILLYIVGLLAYFGIKFVKKFAGVALLLVLLSILSVFVGIFVNMHGHDQLQLCVLGNRLLGEVDNCTKAFGSTLWKLYCPPPASTIINPFITSLLNNNNNDSSFGLNACDPYFAKHDVKLVQGIRGLASGVFYDNLRSAYMEQGQLISTTFSDDDILPSSTTTTIITAAATTSTNTGTLNSNNNGGNGNGTEMEKVVFNQIVSDITTSFTILVGIFFPSVTGVLAGCNHSGELKDPQKSIPRGTIGAIVTITIIYVTSVFLIAGTTDNLLLRDKFGQSVGGRLVVANLAWPNEWIVLIGALSSSIGIALQCLNGAPKLLQAIAKDNILPFLHPFAKCSLSGEPTRALLLTLLFCQLGILLGNVDDLAPLLSKFFLMCHLFVNFACVLQTILKAPNWRPRFRYYHWSLSLIGLILSIAIMFMTSWYFAVLTMVLAACFYKYIEYVGAENEWGDGIGGLALSAARLALLHLEAGPVATKNWRPQILILVKLNERLEPEERKLFSFVSQLKAGKGLTIAVSVLEGEFQNRIADVMLAREHLLKCIQEEKVQGFCDVLITGDIRSGISSWIQVSGLGGLKPNTVMLGWSSNWRERSEVGVFLRTVHEVAAAKMALLVPKGIHLYPSSTEEISGTIDVWWIIHEGGLLMLLPFLLKQHRTWKNCKMRIFTVAQIEDNSTAMKKDLELFLYALRIDAEVVIVEMLNSDISDYTYERTTRMELRNELVKDFQSRDYRVAIKRMRSVAEELAASDCNIQDKLHQIQAIMESHIYKSGNIDESEGGGTPAAAAGAGAEPQHSSRSNVLTPREATTSTSGSTRFPPAAASYGGESQSQSVEIEDKDLDFIALEMFRKNHRKIHKHWRNTTLTPKGHEENVRRMHTAVKLNEAILSKSFEAALVIIKMPAPPTPINAEMEANYLEYLEAMTEGLSRTLMIRGGGREFLTFFS